MYWRKKTQVRIAYVLLTATGVGLVVHDSIQRATSVEHNAESPLPTPAPVNAAPSVAIVPLAESQFIEANREAFLISKSADKRPAAKATPPGPHHATPSGVYFLKVAMEVPSKNGPISMNRGTRVRLVREQDGKLRVRRNTTDFLIEKSQVTDDLNELAALARNSS